MKKILLILTVALLLFCTACKDKDVYSDSSDVNSKDNSSSVATESQGDSVADNSTVSGGINKPVNESSGTVSTVVDEIVITEPTSSVITAIDLETGEEVQVTVTSNPTSSVDGASSNTSSSSSSTAPSSSEQQSSSSGETTPEQSSSTVSSVDPDRDTMDGFTPWR